MSEQRAQPVRVNRVVCCVTAAVLTIGLAAFGSGVSAQDAGAPPAPSAAKAAAIRSIDRHGPELISLSDQVWAFAEIALREHRSSKLLADYAQKQGFRVERGIAGMPTAFVASYGSGRPVIAIMGEYDALPGLSQKAQSSKAPLVEGAPGHGCGHNMFGAASLGAALAIKEQIQAGSLKGTIRFYGTPAEEDIGGKTYMARDGVFNDVDVMLAWHPGDETKADTDSSQAMVDLAIEFHGRAAHAANDPWNGRSAVDGLELFTAGVNLMREHIKPSSRLHYTIVDGGDVPNVVPEYAKVWLWARDWERAEVESLLARIRKLAEGAAIMTETTSNVTVQAGSWEVLPNLAGARLLDANLQWLGPVSYSDEEQVFARAIQRATGVPETGMDMRILPLDNQEQEGKSTDVGDVSWVVPTVQARVATVAIGTPGHSWQITAQGKSGQAKKGMVNAAKAMAGVAADALNDVALIARAKADLKARTDAMPYVSPLPADLQPPIGGRF